MALAAEQRTSTKSKTDDHGDGGTGIEMIRRTLPSLSVSSISDVSPSSPSTSANSEVKGPTLTLTSTVPASERLKTFYFSQPMQRIRYYFNYQDGQFVEGYFYHPDDNEQDEMIQALFVLAGATEENARVYYEARKKQIDEKYKSEKARIMREHGLKKMTYKIETALSNFYYNLEQALLAEVVEQAERVLLEIVNQTKETLQKQAARGNSPPTTNTTDPAKLKQLLGQTFDTLGTLHETYTYNMGKAARYYRQGSIYRTSLGRKLFGLTRQQISDIPESCQLDSLRPYDVVIDLNRELHSYSYPRDFSQLNITDLIEQYGAEATLAALFNENLSETVIDQILFNALFDPRNQKINFQEALSKIPETGPACYARLRAGFLKQAHARAKAAYDRIDQEIESGQNTYAVSYDKRNALKLLRDNSIATDTHQDSDRNKKKGAIASDPSSAGTVGEVKTNETETIEKLRSNIVTAKANANVMAGNGWLRTCFLFAWRRPNGSPKSITGSLTRDLIEGTENAMTQLGFRTKRS